MVYKVRTYGDPVLRKKSLEVEKIDEKIVQLLADMVETMHKYEGVGLAAPQIGIRKKIVVIEYDEIIYKLINPKIIEKKGEEVISEEGCLSIPELYEKVERRESIIAEYTNEHGEKINVELTGFLSRAFQHELDHLNGILFVDRISKVTKRRISNKLKKMKKATLKDIKKEGVV